MAEPRDIKAHAHRLIDDLPDDATWDDVAYAVEVCQSIAAGLADAAAGRTVTHEAAMASARAIIRKAAEKSAGV